MFRKLILLGLAVPLNVAAQPVAPGANLPLFTPVPSSAITDIPQLRDLTYAQSNPRNFVRSYAPLKPDWNPNNTSLNLYSGAPYTSVITKYLDGLGRPLQDVHYMGIRTMVDRVQVYGYNNRGLEAYKYRHIGLPNYGFMVNDPETQIASSGFPMFGDAPWSHIKFENAPAARPVEIQKPGLVYVGANRGLQTQYLSNEAGDHVISWTIGNQQTDLPAGAAFFPAGALRKLRTTDEDGKITEVYTDNRGREICNRKCLTLTPSGSYDPAQWLQTYRVYDLMGRLRFVISPKAVVTSITASHTASISQSVAEGLCFSYWYDGRGRVIEKRVPGKGVEEFVYNDHDEVILYQDGNMRAKGQWAYTLYDVHRRKTEEGVYEPGYSTTTAQIRSDLAQNWSWQPSNLYHHLGNLKRYATTPVSINGCTRHSEYYYDTYPTGIAGISGAYMYDDYLFTLSGTPISPYATSLTYPYMNAHVIYSCPNVRGLMTASRIRVMDGGNSWITSSFIYDQKAQLIQTKTTNQFGGTDRITNLLSFEGRMLMQAHTHTNPNALHNQQTQFVKRWELSPSTGEPVAMYMRTNSDPEILIYKNTYNNYGEIVQKQSGSFFNNYTYDVQGRLTGINPAYVNNPYFTATGPFFGEKLSYDNGHGSRLYNGNIAGIQWRKSQGAPAESYGYTYDATDRLSHAEYRKYENTASPSPWIKTREDHTASNIVYDANGNIEQMYQRGPVTVGGAIAPGDMDKLSYSYEPNSNRLASVTELSTETPGNAPDFRDNGATGSTDYHYDANGNLDQDLNKSIGVSASDRISYNLQNKPALIKVDGASGGTIAYTYDGTGQLLKKVVDDGTKVTTTDYIGPFIYVDRELHHLNHEEGRCRIDPASSTGAFTYDFFVKDHLGNVRTVVGTQAVSVTGPIVTNPNETPVPGIRSYLATMEVSSANKESLFWGNLDSVRQALPFWSDTADKYGAQLDGAVPHRRIGTALMLRVMPGDRCALSGKSLHEGQAPFNPGSSPADVANSLLTTLIGGTANDINVAELPQNMQLLNNAIGGGSFLSTLDQVQQQAMSDPSLPQSFLNYIVLDENFQSVDAQCGAIPVGAADEWSHGSIDGVLEIEQPGYILVFTSNASAKKVFWDQITFTVYQGTVLEENHYYPFGLTLSSATTFANERNNHKYQGIELESRMGLEAYEAFYRTLDPQIGRFNQVDPKSELDLVVSPYASMRNNPASNVDPLGDVVLGVENRPVTYERGEGGEVIWTNATEDVKIIGNAMLLTPFGEKAFKAWQKAKTEVTLKYDTERAPVDGSTGWTQPTEFDKNGKPILNYDHQYKAITVTVFEKNIDDQRQAGSQMRWAGASREEVIGAVGTHERYHNDPNQIRLDLYSGKTDLNQNRDQNKTIRSEINYREQYHTRYPGLPNQNTWQNTYIRYDFKRLKKP